MKMNGSNYICPLNLNSMSFNFNQIPEERVLHYRFAFELLPRQFFRQNYLLWPALRMPDIGQKSLEEIWKIAPKMHEDLPYLPVEGLELFYRDQEEWEIIEVQMPEVVIFPEASAVYLIKGAANQLFYYAYIPQGLRAHWIELDQDLKTQFRRTKNILPLGKRTEELLEFIK